MRKLDDVENLTAADVMHPRLSTLPASATVADLQEYFARSKERLLALLVDDGRLVGTIAREAVGETQDPDALASALADSRSPTIEASAPASVARDIASAQPSLRLPVLDDAGKLVGIVAINPERGDFC